MTDVLLNVLQQLIDEYGVEILEDPDRLLQFLDDRCRNSDATVNFRFTFALHAVIKAGWNVQTGSTAAKRAVYIDKLVSQLAFQPKEAENFLDLLAELTKDNNAESSDSEALIAQPGNLKKISGGIANHPRTMWLRKKIFYNSVVLFAAFVAIAVLFFQIGRQRNPIGAEFRIAFLAPISEKSVNGQTQLKAAQLAVEKINRQGGIRGYKLNVVGVDIPDNPEDASKKVESVLQDKSILLMLTSLNGITAKRLSEVAVRMEIPLILTAANFTKDVIEDEDGRPYLYSFRLAGNADETARLMVYYAVQGLKGRRIGLLTDTDDQYSSEMSESVRKWARAYGRRIVADVSYGNTGNGYTDALNKIKAGRADILLLPGNTKQLAELSARLLTAGYNGKVLGTNFNEAFEDSLTDCMAESSWWINPLSIADPQILSVLKDYKKLYNEKCSVAAAQEAIFVYDAVRWAAVALYKAPGYRGEAIRHGLLSTRNVALAHATLTTDPRTHGPLDKAFALIRLSQGKTIFQRRISVKSAF